VQCLGTVLGVLHPCWLAVLTVWYHKSGTVRQYFNLRKRRREIHLPDLPAVW
jgi:hypothetical protein